ncbi:YkgJ family cysteine cluster protein [Desulforhopalus sp. IMCC35007]|uniref:YkgJ family cysteine cluster protein n=1 Tax=Desulforhopalus sp. IMCC35007 TaxID=2569543 RepID=UPI0010ADD2B6|nr:YkgJ family cysteine cluster protein [Desulforhopalus sp. IMCC35007]TKB11674.1 YkgJ family cysteine cluster protein [Desulforhopalus sp. IMCC35007]
MKHKILHSIYTIFEDWSSKSNPHLACCKGCSTCCTQNVTITALEGEDILRYVITKKMVDKFATALLQSTDFSRPKYTTNDFAKACLDGRDLDPEIQSDNGGCPFLENNLCTIYPVRPFSCRLFVSDVTCSPGNPAQVSDLHLEASTAVTQVIEHLGQKEYWGNMFDVLLALLDIGEYREIADRFNQTLIIQARMCTLTAKPLPGFLLSEEEGPKVAQLLETIFETEVDHKRIEDILNGK